MYNICIKGIVDQNPLLKTNLDFLIINFQMDTLK